ncbi:hypothetical protein A2U01_0027022, partial [Trifolium medium]|nr:hypothetical protein [Trifolium medium]
KKEHYKLIKTKGIVQERSIDFTNITFLPRMQEIAEGYGWMDLNNMIDNCNISWVEEFYANVLGRPDDDFTSYWRERAHTEDEYTEMPRTLALPGRDWHYTSREARSRLQITDMMPVAKGWAKWLVRNFESCSNETEIIMSRCHTIYAIMRGEPIQIGEMIARSIKRMITGLNSYIGHPFINTTLCQRLHVPIEDDTDEIAIPMDPIDRVFFRRAVRDLEAAQAATATPQPPPPAPHHQQHQQHQVPPHIPQQHQYSDYELGMAAT